MSYRRKLIEVALPLDAINKASAKEKSIRQGHPSTLHLWWARRPLAACRAVLFASLVDDPSADPERFPTEDAQQLERDRLFSIIEEMVLWENIGNPLVLERAKREIPRNADGELPTIWDPFSGGGSIPLEAQRLGLEVHASDLNPVAVLITKALVEIPHRFAGQPPINPDQDAALSISGWVGARGLADDVKYYGRWMRQQAFDRIGHLFPEVDMPRNYGGGRARVIAWLWARTVVCPNPACGAQMPLAKSFLLSSSKERRAWVEPLIDSDTKSVRFEVHTGSGPVPDPSKIGRGAKFRCLVCEQIADDQHIKDEGMAGRMGAQLMAIAAEGNRQRLYVSPSEEHERVAATASPAWAPDEELPYEPRAIWCTLYGLTRFRDLFTARQLVVMSTFNDLVSEARKKAFADAAAAGLKDDGLSLHEGGIGARAYADAITTYLACCVSAISDDLSSLVTWRSGHGTGATRSTFARQALPMAWDFAEANPFAGAAGDIAVASQAVAQALAATPASSPADVNQLDATKATNEAPVVICTDPPYYDNIGYADLADFFYVWLRRSLRDVYPQLFSTLTSPKQAELVASPYRFDGDKRKAERFFENGIREAFARMRAAQDPDYPLTVFYAFKQAEEDDRSGVGGAPLVASTGWEKMLEGLLQSGFAVTGTWPMRSERGGRMLAVGTNALASSIVLVCRPRPASATLATRKELVSSLRKELPRALRILQQRSIAPVDLAQAAIGPGMAVFSQFARVVEADGSSMTVRTGLGLINQILDEVLSEQEGEYDSATRWAIAWFEQKGLENGPYGEAETLATAKGVAVAGLVADGFLSAKGGKVRLLSRDELDRNWDPTKDTRLTIWEVTQNLVKRLDDGEDAASELLRKVGALGEAARDLAYRLYATCERKGWTTEALGYNALVVAWPDLTRIAAAPRAGEQQSMT